MFMKKISAASDRLSNLILIRVLRRGMTMLIPMILTASLALAVTAFPIPAVANFIRDFAGGVLYTVLSYIKDFSFSYFSVMLAMAVSISYVLEKKQSLETSVFAPLASCVSFLLISRIGSGGAETKLGTQGSFLAIVVSLAVSAAYVRLINSRLGKVWELSSGHDVIYRSAMRAVMPLLPIMLCASLVSFLIYNVCGIDNITLWMGAFFDEVVSGLKNDFAAAVVCTLLIHSLWFLGIHGSNVMDSVMQAHTAVGSDIIFSKTFFDCFVVMGGCGTSICIVIAVLLFSKYDKLKNIVRPAALPVALNINEIITFGLPIIWNPIMLIPFMLVPLECTVIAYTAFKLGLAAPIVSEVNWTTPILMSGYIATGGSISGVLLQAVNVAVGTLTYLPFIRAYEEFDAEHIKAQIAEMTAQVRESEINDGEVTFLEQTDTLGVAANMLMNELHEAVRNREMYFLYQPQFRADGTCVGAEALIRWEHPAAGLLYPPLIIFLAKRGGFLSELEEHIFDSACRAIKQTGEESGRQFKISVNITAKSLKWDGLEACISDAVERYGVDPSRLWIEITEKDVVSKDAEIADKINSLRSRGHKFLIDDFGMGRTSILYLQTALFDGVKLDGSLTKTILSDKTSREIVSSVIELSGKLGVRVIAEYVENREECELLDRLGCDWYQGYYFSKPVPLEEFIGRLNGKQNTE